MMNYNTRRSGCPHPDNNQHKIKSLYVYECGHNDFVLNNGLFGYANLCRDEGNPTYGGFYD